MKRNNMKRNHKFNLIYFTCIAASRLKAGMLGKSFLSPKFSRAGADFLLKVPCHFPSPFSRFLSTVPSTRSSLCSQPFLANLL